MSVQTFELTPDRIMFILIGAVIAVFIYIIIFHAIPFAEEREMQLDEIKNKMSCGELQEMILDRTGLSVVNRAEVKHQYEWRCEK